MSNQLSYSERDPLIINDTEKALKYQRNNSHINNTQEQTVRRNNFYCNFLKWFSIILIGTTILFFLTNMMLYDLYINDQMHLSYTNSDTYNVTTTWITSEEYGNYDTFLEYYKYNDSIKTQAQVEQHDFTMNIR